MSDSREPADQQTAGALFRAGKLADAVAAANAAVRKSPADLAPRVLLAELLLFAGNLERADVILDAGSSVDPQAAVVIAEFRQLVRAEMARRQQRRDGRLPEFLGEPTATLATILQATIALRARRRRRGGCIGREGGSTAARAWPAPLTARRSTTSAMPMTFRPGISKCSPRPANISGSQPSESSRSTLINRNGLEIFTGVVSTCLCAVARTGWFICPHSTGTTILTSPTHSASAKRRTGSRFRRRWSAAPGNVCFL